MAWGVTIFRRFDETHAHLDYPYCIAFNLQQVQRRTLPGATGLMKPNKTTNPLSANKRSIVIQNRRAQFGVGPARDELSA